MKIALLGYGRMGKEIEKLALERHHEIVLKIDSDYADLLNAENIKSADVAIDFSTPESAFFNISFCIDHGVPVVSGTTGWLKKFSDVQHRVENKKGAFFYASNYSVGMNLFFEVNKKLAQLMNPFSNYAVKMEEIHHTGKKDEPSGTAITLAEGIIENIDRYSNWSLLHGDELTADNTFPIRSVRRDPVPGTHTIEYDSEIDTITLRHEAKSRAGFALGAILAAEFLPGKSGIYGMNDLLKL